MNGCGCRRRNSNPVAGGDGNLNFTFDKKQGQVRGFSPTSRVRGWGRQNPPPLVAMPSYLDVKYDYRYL